MKINSILALIFAGGGCLTSAQVDYQFQTVSTSKTVPLISSPNSSESTTLGSSLANTARPSTRDLPTK